MTLRGAVLVLPRYRRACRLLGARSLSDLPAASRRRRQRSGAAGGDLLRCARQLPRHGAKSSPGRMRPEYGCRAGRHRLEARLLPAAAAGARDIRVQAQQVGCRSESAGLPPSPARRNRDSRRNDLDVDVRSRRGRPAMSEGDLGTAGKGKEVLADLRGPRGIQPVDIDVLALQIQSNPVVRIPAERRLAPATC